MTFGSWCFAVNGSGLVDVELMSDLGDAYNLIPLDG